MRRPFIAGNWKMNLNRAAAVALAEAVAQQASGVRRRGPGRLPAGLLSGRGGPRAGRLQGGPGAPRTCTTSQNGAFTGEISAAMLCDLGCRYVILGHSERRHILGETDAEINKKVHAALAAGLIPIVCVGELLAEREAGKTPEVIRSQFAGSLAGVPADQMREDRDRLRAGLGDRHGKGGHAAAGRGGPSRSSQDHGRPI